MNKNQLRLRSIYKSARKRCNNKNSISYKNYGGKGIKFFFKDIKDFEECMMDSYIIHLNMYGEKNTTLDRIDNNGNYCKENCRWATIRQQQENKKNPVRYFTYKGETHTQGEWIKILGLNR